MFQKAKEIVIKAMFPVFSISSKNKGPPTVINLKGTGFFIDSKGLLISASHVFEKNNKDLTYLYKGIPSLQGINKHFEIEEVFRNEKKDLFIGKIQMKTPSFLKLENCLIEEKTRICLGGYPNPNHLEHWIETSISKIDRLNLPNFNFLGYFTNDLAHPCMSGGPAFNFKSSVIGMISGNLNSKFGTLLISKTIIEIKEHNI